VELSATAAAALSAPTPLWIVVAAVGVVLALYAVWQLLGDEADPTPAAGTTLAASGPGHGDVRGNVIQNSTVTVTTVAPAGEHQTKRQVLDVSLEYLTGLFADHTDYQGEKLTEAYIGKLLKVSGPVNNVSPWQNAFAIVDLQELPGVLLIFTDEAYVKDRVAVLRVGHQVSVVGEIKKISRYSIWLDHCELVEGDQE
jgi:hypothetical protein